MISILSAVAHVHDREILVVRAILSTVIYPVRFEQVATGSVPFRCSIELLGTGVDGVTVRHKLEAE